MNRVEQAMAASRRKTWRVIVVGEMLSIVDTNLANMAMKVKYPGRLSLGRNGPN